MVLLALAFTGLRGHPALWSQKSLAFAAEPPAERHNGGLSRTPYQQVGRFAVGVRTARGLAFGPDGTLWVAGDRMLSHLSVDGRLLKPIRLKGEPYCLAVARDGTQYVGMRDHVEVYSATGALRARWHRPAAQSHLTSIALSPDTVWVADAGARVVWRYSRSGKLLGQIGKRDDSRGVPGLLVPSPHLDVAVPTSDDPSLVWVSNPGRHRLEAYTPSGTLKRTWGKYAETMEGFTGCCNPTDFALLPDGRFVTSEKGVPRVKIYRSDGTLEALVAPPEVFSQKAPGHACTSVGLDLAVDRRGRIWVLDPMARAVRVFASKQGGS